MKRSYIFIYISLAILVVATSFSYIFFDQMEFLGDGYFVSQGLVPYTNFFEHHPALHMYFLSWMFDIVGTQGSSILFFHAFAILLTFVMAYLVYSVASQNGMKHPHFASMLFLASYAGLANSFTRYEFYCTFVLLLFFYFKKEYIKGACLGVLAVLSPVTLAPTMAIAAVSCLYLYFTKTSKLLPFMGGVILGVTAGLLPQLNVSLSRMWFYVWTFNNRAAPFFRQSFTDVAVSLLLFTLPIMLLGMWGLWKFKDRNRRFAMEIAIFAGVFLVQVLMMNIVYGPFTRLKMPAYLPLIAILCIFIAELRPNYARVFIIAQLLLTLVFWTPTFPFPVLAQVHLSDRIDSCVAPDAKIDYFSEAVSLRKRPLLYRLPSQYDWFSQNNIEMFKVAGTDYPPAPSNDIVTVCGYGIRSSDLLCSEDILQQIQKDCDQLPTPPEKMKVIQSYLAAFVNIIKTGSPQRANT